MYRTIGPGHHRHFRWSKLLAALVLAAVHACVHRLHESSPELITAEGIASTGGNNPRAAVVLETAERNLYPVDLDDEARLALEGTLPARLQVTGHSYLGNWQRRQFAHLRPTDPVPL